MLTLEEYRKIAEGGEVARRARQAQLQPILEERVAQYVEFAVAKAAERGRWRSFVGIAKVRNVLREIQGVGEDILYDTIVVVLGRYKDLGYTVEPYVTYKDEEGWNIEVPR